jgi:hypothetical protein
MRIAHWILKATKAHSECVILTDFPLQQWLQERASMLTYTYIASLLFLALVLIGAVASGYGALTPVKGGRLRIG